MTKESQGFLNFILPKCSWFTVLSWFLVYSKVILLHTCLVFMFFPIMVSVAVVVLAFYTVRNRCTSGRTGVSLGRARANRPGGATLTRGRGGSLPASQRLVLSSLSFPEPTGVSGGWRALLHLTALIIFHILSPLSQAFSHWGVEASQRHLLSCSFRLASSPPFSLGSLLNTPETASSSCIFIQTSPPCALVFLNFPPCYL